MALTTVPGQVGYKAHRISSLDKRTFGKLTDTNHMWALAGPDAPAMYDRGVIEIFTQTSQESDDFLQMVNKSTPFMIPGETWQWKLQKPYDYPKLVEKPTTTINNPNLGIGGIPFELVFDSDYFRPNDIITANRMHGDNLYVVSGPTPYGLGFLYSVKLTGANVTTATTVDQRLLTINTEFDKMDNVTGEFDTRGTGLNGPGQTIDMFESLAAGYLADHQITKWADTLMPRDSKGNPLDIIVYDAYTRDNTGKVKSLGSRWEPFIEAEMRKEMMKVRKNRILFGKGGDVQTNNHRQENKKITEGIISKMRNYGNQIDFNKGDFSLNLIRETFGELFYRRVATKDRRVKLYTNEAGMKLFRQANKDDLMAAGFTIIADERFIQGSGQNMIVNYGFEAAVTMETGLIEVAHLMELDLPQLNSEYGQNAYSAPVFMAFDVSNPTGGMFKGIREVRQEGAPSMTWGYVDGRQSHLGHYASKGMQSASMEPGYQIWMEDRCDVFIEDLSRCVIMEQIPQF